MYDALGIREEERLLLNNIANGGERLDINGNEVLEQFGGFGKSRYAFHIDRFLRSVHSLDTKEESNIKPKQFGIIKESAYCKVE